MSPVVLIVGAVVLLGVIAAAFLARGQRPPPASPKLGGTGPQKWTVTKLTQETPSSVSLEFDATLAFEPGQFVLVRPLAELNWRAYSFSRAPGQPLRLTIKRVPNGAVSTHLSTQTQLGNQLEVKGPYGHFVLPKTWQRALFVAGGSGVTPFLSMLHAEAAAGWQKPIVLIDANRTAKEQILKAELDALVAGSGGKLEVLHLLDDGEGAAQGPLTKERLTALVPKLGTPDVVAMCGPEPMMNVVREVVTAAWVPVTVLEEKFSAATEVSGGGPAHEVTVVEGSKTRSFPVREGEHVLAAARNAGVGLTAGCEMGACGVCRVKVLEGQVAIPDDACLSDGEKAQGYSLVCVGTVKGNCRIQPAP
jgi:ferredoxin-NADP reductase